MPTYKNQYVEKANEYNVWEALEYFIKKLGKHEE